MMQIYDRNGFYLEEKEYLEGLLEFLYNTVIGRILLKNIVIRPWFSAWRGHYYDSTKSKKDIPSFVEKNNIDISVWNINEFKTFNEFFRRKKDIEIVCSDSDFISIADSKLSVYPIDENVILKVKKSVYSIEDIVGKKEIADEYRNGVCLVFRLGVDDYHRYIYLDNGKIVDNYKIDGELHTVRSISEKYNVFSRNSREISVLRTENMGDVIQVEVGALLVGAIKNNDKKEFLKGEEKGYFEYGGSTIVLLFKEGVVSLDEDIVTQSKLGVETKVSIGERIGTVC